MVASCVEPRAGLDASVGPDAAVIDAPTTDFGSPVTLSDPASSAFAPVLAQRAGRVVIAWHEFPAGATASRLMITTIAQGSVGPVRIVPETFTGAKRPSLAATTGGFVLAWQAMDAGTERVRSIDLDAEGVLIGAPTTIGAGAMARVAARGDDVAWAWTDGASHWFARRGPAETVSATQVGTVLQSQGLVNFPRIALAADGKLVLAYRDGGPESTDLEVLIVTRAPGAAFTAPVNVSHSTGLLSDDISVAAEPNGTIDLVWVDQDANVDAFEITSATRSPAGVVSSPTKLSMLGSSSWTPSVASGMAAVWHVGPPGGGELWQSSAGSPARAILPGERGGMVAVMRDLDALHLAYSTVGAPRQIRYTRMPQTTVLAAPQR